MQRIDIEYTQNRYRVCSLIFIVFLRSFVRKMNQHRVRITQQFHVHNDADQPLTYDRPADIDDREVTVRVTVGGDTKKATAKIWRATEGQNLESYCEVYNLFNEVMKDWGWSNNGTNKFTAFPHFLDGVPRQNFNRISAKVRAADGTNAISFEKTVKLLVESITGENPRAKATDYLSTPECIKKRHDTSVAAHASRLMLLFFYHDMLPGFSDKLNEDNASQERKRKLILFSSFPDTWQEAARDSRIDPEDVNVKWHNIVSWMTTHKTRVDADAARSRIRRQLTGGPGSRGQRAGRGGGRGHGSQRRSHGGRGYSRSPSYRPYPQQPQQQRAVPQGNYYPQQQRTQSNGYRPPFQPRYQGYNRYNGGRGRYTNNNRFQGGRNQGNQNNQGRGRGNQSYHHETTDEHYFGEYGGMPEQNDEHYYQNEYEYNGREPSAEMHHAEQHFTGGNPAGGIPGAEMHNYYNQNQNHEDNFHFETHIGDEHYGYEDSAFSFDNVYGYEE